MLDLEITHLFWWNVQSVQRLAILDVPDLDVVLGAREEVVLILLAESDVGYG